jgi:hypothetical protein
MVNEKELNDFIEKNGGTERNALRVAMTKCNSLSYSLREALELQKALIAENAETRKQIRIDLRELKRVVDEKTAWQLDVIIDRF